MIKIRIGITMGSISSDCMNPFQKRYRCFKQNKNQNERSLNEAVCINENMCINEDVIRLLRIWYKEQKMGKCFMYSFKGTVNGVKF